MKKNKMIVLAIVLTCVLALLIVAVVIMSNKLKPTEDAPATAPQSGSVTDGPTPPQETAPVAEDSLGDEPEQPAMETDPVEEQTQTEAPAQTQKPTEATNTTQPTTSTKPSNTTKPTKPKDPSKDTEPPEETDPTAPVIETPIESTPEETKDGFNVDFDDLLGGAN